MKLPAFLCIVNSRSYGHAGDHEPAEDNKKAASPQYG